MMSFYHNSNNLLTKTALNFHLVLYKCQPVELFNALYIYIKEHYKLDQEDAKIQETEHTQNIKFWHNVDGWTAIRKIKSKFERQHNH